MKIVRYMSTFKEEIFNTKAIREINISSGYYNLDQMRLFTRFKNILMF